mgnify:CR=1 FL=1
MCTTLRARVLMLLAAFGLVITAALALISYQSVRAYYTDLEFKRSNEFAQRLVDIHTDLWKVYKDDPASFGEKLQKYILYAPNTGLYLLDNDGRVLSSAGEQRLFWSNYRVDMNEVTGAMSSSPEQPIFADDPDMIGGKCLVAARQIMWQGEPRGWLYVVARNAEADTEPLAILKAYAMRTGLKISLLTIGLCVLLTMAIIALLTRPLVALTKVAEEIKQSGFTNDTNILGCIIPNCERDDEIGRLGRAFQEMLSRLREEMQRVTQADAKRRDSLPAEQRKLLYQRALHNAEHLKRLTNSLAEISRLDNPEFKAQPEPMALGELTDDVVQRFIATAESRDVRLSVDYQDGLPMTAVDASLIERALSNLIDNALRVTPAGGTVAVSVEQRPDGVRVQVRDSGPGVAESDQPRVFDLFYQASKHREHRGSSGLGLALVRRVAELHGGIAGLQSEPGNGSTFFIDLPAIAGIAHTA